MICEPVGKSFPPSAIHCTLWQRGRSNRKGSENGVVPVGTRRTKLIRLVRLAAVGSAAIFCLCIVVVCALLQRKPAWYRPVDLDEQLLQRVRRETAAAADDFGDRLVAGRRFEIQLRDSDINAWLSAAPLLWPEVQGHWPAYLTGPAIQFGADRVLLGAHLEVSGWRIIATAEVQAHPSGDLQHWQLRLHKCYGGELPLPRFLIDQIATRNSPQDRKPDGDEFTAKLSDVDQLFSGVPLRNRFVWPNGKRPFRIAQLHSADGVLRVVIDPL